MCDLRVDFKDLPNASLREQLLALRLQLTGLLVNVALYWVVSLGVHENAFYVASQRFRLLDVPQIFGQFWLLYSVGCAAYLLVALQLLLDHGEADWILDYIEVARGRRWLPERVYEFLALVFVDHEVQQLLSEI